MTFETLAEQFAALTFVVGALLGVVAVLGWYIFRHGQRLQDLEMDTAVRKAMRGAQLERKELPRS